MLACCCFRNRPLQLDLEASDRSCDLVTLRNTSGRRKLQILRTLTFAIDNSPMIIRHARAFALSSVLYEDFAERSVLAGTLLGRTDLWNPQATPGCALER